MPTATHLSLRALRHPFTLASIAILLINDHWLKTATPSALTGKLSDFAGLFFFPFLLAALLSAARLPARPTFLLALAITGGWFALMKTTLWANALTRATLSAVWGGPVSIVLDPTDCWALVMFFPAWLLWCNLERERASQPPGKLALAALGVAVLASLATSPCMNPPTLTRLAVDGPEVFVRADNLWGQGDFRVAKSLDGGQSWNFVETAPQIISDTLSVPIRYPIVACVPDNPTVCYRLPDASRIERSVDSGQSWQTDWQIPWGRLSFMQRSVLIPLSCNVMPNPTLSDLVAISTPSGHRVVAIMGNQGAVVKNEQQIWNRYEILGAEPTPWAVSNRDELLTYLLPEISIIGESVIVSLSFFVLVFWSQIQLKRSKAPVIVGWVLTATTSLVLVTFLVSLPKSPGPGWQEIVLSWFMWPMLYIIILLIAWPPIWAIFLGVYLISFWIWQNISKIAPNPAAAAQLGKLITATALGFLLLGWLPFVLWAFGIIPVYEMALALSAALIAFLLWRAWPKIISLRQQALTPPAV